MPSSAHTYSRRSMIAINSYLLSSLYPYEMFSCNRDRERTAPTHSPTHTWTIRMRVSKCNGHLYLVSPLYFRVCLWGRRLKVFMKGVIFSKYRSSRDWFTKAIFTTRLHDLHVSHLGLCRYLANIGSVHTSDIHLALAANIASRHGCKRFSKHRLGHRGAVLVPRPHLPNDRKSARYILARD